MWLCVAIARKIVKTADLQITESLRPGAAWEELREERPAVSSLTLLRNLYAHGVERGTFERYVRKG